MSFDLDTPRGQETVRHMAPNGTVELAIRSAALPGHPEIYSQKDIEKEKELAEIDFPVHVLSLRDFVMLMDRFDTAGDFVPYLEFCYDLRASLNRRVHAEEVTTQRVADRIGDLMKRYKPGIANDVLERSVRHLRLTAAAASASARGFF